MGNAPNLNPENVISFQVSQLKIKCRVTESSLKGGEGGQVPISVTFKSGETFLSHIFCKKEPILKFRNSAHLITINVYYL